MWCPALIRIATRPTFEVIPWKLVSTQNTKKSAQLALAAMLSHLSQRLLKKASTLTYVTNATHSTLVSNVSLIPVAALTASTSVSVLYPARSNPYFTRRLLKENAPAFFFYVVMLLLSALSYLTLSWSYQSSSYRFDGLWSQSHLGSSIDIL